MITIQLTNDEAQALVQLLDIAVKAGGIRVAQPALQLTQKLDEAAKAGAMAKAPAPVEPEGEKQ